MYKTYSTECYKIIIMCSIIPVQTAISNLNQTSLTYARWMSYLGIIFFLFCKGFFSTYFYMFVSLDAIHWVIIMCSYYALASIKGRILGDIPI